MKKTKFDIEDDDVEIGKRKKTEEEDVSSNRNIVKMWVEEDHLRSLNLMIFHLMMSGLWKMLKEETMKV